MTSHKTVFDNDFQIVETDNGFDYQTLLTPKLDKLDTIFDQNVINEIVLWKVDRYAQIEDEVLNLINQIDVCSKELDFDLTKRILIFC
jgi:hypothetical protein